MTACWFWTGKKRIVDLNKAALDIFRIGVNDFIGKSFDQLQLDEIDRSMFLRNLDEDDSQIDWERQGAVYDLSFSHVLRRGKMIGYLLVLRDITQRKQMEENLKELAFTDSITGLLNHRNLFKLGEQELFRAVRYSPPFDRPDAGH